MAESKKKGRVFIQTSKGVYPYSVLQKAETTAEESQQLKSDTEWMTQHHLITPPYPPNVLLTLYESNAIFCRCVDQVAIDVAGLGWNVKLREGKKENAEELKRINEFLDQPNPDDNLRTILKNLIIDWGAIGWFAIEVVRDNAGRVGKIFHLPAHTLRVHKDQQKFCQIRNQKKVWFKKFGLEGDITTAAGDDLGDSDQNLKANELLYFKNPYPKSDYYGTPNILPALGDVIGLIGLRDYNLAFFENYGVPAAIIVLEGEWDEGSDDQVSDFLNKELKGTENAYKTLVVSQPEECKFTYKPLGVEVKETSFRVYEQARRETILTAYSMPPERIGIRIVGKLGGNVAEEATKIYVQGVVRPLQQDLEEIINNKLLMAENYQFKFEAIDLRDYDVLIKQLGYEIERGMTTPNEARNTLGRKPYAEGDKFYMLSSLIEVGEAEPEEALSKSEAEFLHELDDS